MARPLPLQSRLSRWPVRIAAAVVVALVAAGAWWWWKQRAATPDEGRYRTTQVERGSIRVAISATGTLSALSTVDVGSEVSGKVTEVLVDYNDHVRKGQVIARIDPDTFTPRIAQGDAAITLRTRVARQVTIGHQRFKLAIELQVQDNGPGVPADLRERIFQPLVSGREGGTGLGLALAQTFVQQHEGTIEHESADGSTRFTLLIPVR